jgi:hypothetical protein
MSQEDSLESLRVAALALATNPKDIEFTDLLTNAAHRYAAEDLACDRRFSSISYLTAVTEWFDLYLSPRTKMRLFRARRARSAMDARRARRNAVIFTGGRS